jgi:hypothetical protein
VARVGPEDLISPDTIALLRAQGWDVLPVIEPRRVREAVQFALFLHLGQDAHFTDLQFVTDDIMGRLVALGIVTLDP